MKKTKDKREIALNRDRELKSKIQDYLDLKDLIPNGMSEKYKNKALDKKHKLLSILNANENDWNDYKWQLKSRVTDVNTLTQVLNLTENEIQAIKEVSKSYRWAISPYYLSLIDDENPLDPIKLQSIPMALELLGEGIDDPMGEEFTNPAGSITRRYPDRLIINVTNECAMYCRHCQRRRNIGTDDHHTSKEKLRESIEYIKANPEIRDVLVTGGDAFALSDETLDWLLGELHAIPSVDYVRLGTRTLVTMPQRITENLISILKKYPPIYINTQFNHPLEITPDVKKACDKLSLAGIPLGNQAVLLNGVNNDKFVMRLLNQKLLKCRIKPYYIFHSKEVVGTTHFNTSIDDGLEIMEYLRGYTSGLSVPTYIINAPEGNGKTPIAPQYLISRGKNSVKIRTWEGKVIDYPNFPTENIEGIIKKR